MYLEAFLLWFQHTWYRFTLCSVFTLLSKESKIHCGHCEHCDFGTVSHSAKTRVAGLWAFQPHTTHKQLSCSSSPGLYVPCGQQGVCVGSRATEQPEKYQLESLLWIIYRKLIYRWKAHLAEEHFISQKSLEYTDGESFGEHSGSSSFQYSFVMRFAWTAFQVGNVAI